MRTIYLTVVFALLLAGTSFGAAVFDVRAFGARGDGTTKDTEAIQKAVDAASAAGGGEVFLSPGTYLTGSVWLRDNVDFHLGMGATLKGSPDLADYCASNCCPQNAASRSDNTSGGHLLLGVGVRHVTVRGPGCINGNSSAFLLDAEGRPYRTKHDVPGRPAQMVWFVDSTDIRVTDVELADAPYWSCFLLNCDRVMMRGMYVHTERRRYHTFCGDGVDIDRCRWVTLSDSRIDTADDCITFRASCGAHLADPHDCAYVTVANCNISSSCNAIRPGVGEGSIHDIVVSGVTISDTRTAFNIVGAYSRTSRGPDIRGLRFSQIRVDCTEFLKMHLMYATEAKFSDILFDGVTGSSAWVSHIWSKASSPFSRIVFRDVCVSAGFEALNADITVLGGDFPRQNLDPARAETLQNEIDANRRLLY